MPKFILKSPQVTINAVDLSNHVQEVAISYGAEIKEVTTSGETNKTKLAGLTDWSADITFAQDYAAGKIDATLFPLVGAAEFAVKIKPTNAAISATNPEYQGNALLASYPPIAGKVGEPATAKCTLEGSGVLVRDVIP